jgi:hypothetical protein
VSETALDFTIGNIASWAAAGFFTKNETTVADADGTAAVAVSTRTPVSFVHEAVEPNLEAPPPDSVIGAVVVESAV